MLVLCLKVLAALHFAGLLGIIAMLQMDRFDHIRRNLAIALLVTFGSGTGLVVLLEQIQPFIWDDSGSFTRTGGGAPREGAKSEEGAGGGGKSKEGGAGGGAVTSTSLRPKGVLQDCDLCPEMVTIPAGTLAVSDVPAAERAQLVRDAERVRASEAATGNQAAAQQPIELITVPRFLISRFYISRDEYANFAKAAGTSMPGIRCTSSTGTVGSVTPVKFKISSEGWEPVQCVGQAELRAYTAWLSKVTGNTYRPPAAAENIHAGNTKVLPEPLSEAPGFRVVRDAD